MSFWSILRKLGFGAIVSATVIASAEGAARLDDFLSDGVPFVSNPRNSDLDLNDGETMRGRPHAKYKKWKMNNVGFRGPDITVEKPKIVRRIIILGASETFGLYESPEKEFPAQLRERLKETGGGYEVVNAALAGMELASMRRYWEKWVFQFKPDIVLIYPSPHFYLNESVTRRAVGEPTTLKPAVMTEDRNFESRFLARLRDVIDYPYFIVKWRNDRSIASQVAGKDKSWFFTSVPLDRLQMFATELDMLVETIVNSGALPVLMTHAISAAVPLEGKDYRTVEAHRVFMPRALPEVIVLFDLEANNVVRKIARDRSVPLVDLAQEISGNHEYFADMVHFTDKGAERVANVIERTIMSIPKMAKH